MRLHHRLGQMEPLKTVAIADDEPGMIQVVTLACGSRYEIVGTAKNGQEAITLVKTSAPNLLIMDLHMPVLDGAQALKQIVSLKTTAVVILTADQDSATARQMMDLGAAAYMTKPFDQSQVIPVMESAWHHHQAIAVLQQQTDALTENLETRKLLEKAKGILMEQQGFSEEEAHRTIQKMCQDQGVTVKELCRSLIQVKMVLGGKKKAPKAA
jgi:AmiR/NasT family two-component response regulator